MRQAFSSLSFLDNFTMVKSMKFIVYFIHGNNIVSKSILTTKNVERLKVVMGILTLSYIVNSLEVKRQRTSKYCYIAFLREKSPYGVEIKWV